MKDLLIKLLRFYFAPFKVGTRNFYRIKDLYYTNSSEHLDKVVALAKKDQALANCTRIIDVGAAEGSSLRFFSDQFPTLKVIGFEPNPAMAEHLKPMRSPRIEVYNVALWNRKGEHSFQIADNNVSSSLLSFSSDNSKRANFHLAQSTTVRTEKLDDVIDPNIATLIMKLDTQGTELKILEGGTATLKKTRFVVIEMMNHDYYENSNQYFEVDEFLRDRGFKLKDICIAFRSKNGLEEYDAIYVNTTFS